MHRWSIRACASGIGGNTRQTDRRRVSRRAEGRVSKRSIVSKSASASSHDARVSGGNEVAPSTLRRKFEMREAGDELRLAGASAARSFQLKVGKFRNLWLAARVFAAVFLLHSI